MECQIPEKIDREITTQKKMLHYPKTKSINQTISRILFSKNVYLRKKKKKN